MIRFVLSKLRSIYKNFLIYFLPEEVYLKFKYYKTIGVNLNLKEPKRLTEKIQWLKLFNRKKEHIFLADKYLVRNHIAEKVGKDYLVPLLHFLSSEQEITNQMLTKNTIIKCNHDSSGGVIIRDKIPDLKKIKNDFKKRLKSNHYYQSKEWQYKNMVPKILIEKLLLDKNNKIPNDFKFHCFHGEPKFIYCSLDREGKNYRKIYDTHWNKIDVSWKPFNQELRVGPDIEKPKSLNEMLEISKQLSASLPYCRIDLYDVDGKIYFGEITLHPHGGFEKIEPSRFDLEWGSYLNIDTIK